ncbi:probable 28S ribosomal protein S6, mitochondrial [Daktulosphaira vitifoliae]|uniref:probable 28S ribosomal protein S6, mitochondrial n=1 Tax=Daktulosphaira vitifoliae TaxID=58002 RepID=UPI0021AA4281|nr:probable 28S ribosomal protein S6, mitochondrial [Daktulosphaira vitifoliae]
MPTYELCLLFKVLPRTELASCLKRTASKIFETGGFIRRIDNLGTSKTPWKMSSHDSINKEASYFIVEFDAPNSALKSFNNYLSRDIDIIKRTIFRVTENTSQSPCTLHEELKPPAYRSEVQEMIAIGKRKREKEAKKKVQFNTGLDFMPFQR